MTEIWNDLANSFLVIFSPLINAVAGGTAVAGMFIALFWMIVVPIRRRVQ